MDGKPRNIGPAGAIRLRLLLSLMAFLLVGARTARAELQFDVFLGYEGHVREGAWFPVGFEIHNDGPSFDGVIELSAGQLGSGQVRRFPVELPTNTRKRIVIPAFASGRNGFWDATLKDSRGKVRADRTGIRPKDLVWEATLVGAISRSAAGLPSFPKIRMQRPEIQPEVARIPVEFAPDNPLGYEGLNAVYLNSERALEMKAAQVNALLSWVYGGGHLVVALDQPGDLNGSPWLKQLLPMDATGVSSRKPGPDLEAYVRTTPPPPEGGAGAPQNQQRTNRRRQAAANQPNAPTADPIARLTPDPAFERSEISVVTGRQRDGKVLLEGDGVPLMAQAHRGRGQVTVLCFNPEREPFRNWQNRTWFWARLLSIPPAFFESTDFNAYGGWSADGIFGAMIDSRQIRKLPVEWLLVLLVVYLIVIGPFDQWSLKKINRQMLTWITFPTYVALFSLLIYFIGFKLRHGETEWNELHVVDVLPKGAASELRGRSYFSVYSPVNASYRIASEQPAASLRGEFQGHWRGGQDSSGATVVQKAQGFEADLHVPVWTSQMFVSDWAETVSAPLTAQLQKSGGDVVLQINNQLNRPLSHLKLVLNGRMYDITNAPAKATSTTRFNLANGRDLGEFVAQRGSQFINLVQARTQTFGNNQPTLWDDLPGGATVATFIGQLDRHRVGQRSFLYAPGLDLSRIVDAGQAVLLAWDSGASLVKPFHRFEFKRGQKNTLIRLAIPID